MTRALIALLVLLAGCKRIDPEEREKRILHFGIRSKVSSLDPVHASNEYTNLAQSLVYEGLFEYEYGANPIRLKPLLATAMPEVSEDQRTYTFTIRDDVHFHDDPAFEGGKGRKLTAADVAYSLKRMADRKNDPKGWWLYANRIAGLDELRGTKDDTFDYDRAIEGLEVVDDRTLRIRLVEPYPQFLYVLAMSYAAVVPREAAEKYGAEFGRHPVGTGPFRLVRWAPGVELVYRRNERYRDETYQGRRVPLLDGVNLHVYAQEQPMWLKWRVGDIDLILIPTLYYPAIFDRGLAPRPRFVADGVTVEPYKRLDLVFRGFNMKDPIVGGFEKGKLLRQALSCAYDMAEISDAFYAGAAVVYDGPIPPGLEGHDPDLVSPYRGPNLDKAKKLLAQAGYPNGEGLPPLQFHAHNGGSSPEQAEMLRRQWAKIGVKLEVHLHSFPELNRRIKTKTAQIFSLAWGSDYPDAENNLALFYGPNAPPGSNHFSYDNAEFDELYEKTRVMFPSPERTKIYERMRDMIIEDVPYFGGFARPRNYAWTKRATNIHPNETWWTWLKYVDVEPRR